MIDHRVGINWSVHFLFQNFRPSERFNAGQLWPQKRDIKRNHQRFVNLENESRDAEHPREMMPKNVRNYGKLPNHHQQVVRITPAQNSDSRILRNGYFS